MNKLTHSLVCKVIAIFLFVIFAVGFIGGIIGIWVLYDYGFYGTSFDNVKAKVFEIVTSRYSRIVYYDYFLPNKDNLDEDKKNNEKFYVDSSNFFFNLKDSDGNIILSNYSGQEYQLSYTFIYSNYEYENDIYGNYVTAKDETYTMECFVKKNLDSGDYYYTYERLANTAYRMRYTIIVITVLSLIVLIDLFIFLMCSAGRRKGEDKIMPNGVDKIPFDLLIAIIFMIVGTEALTLSEIEYIGNIGDIILGGLFLIIDILLGLLLCMSFATRYKLGGWWRNTIIYRVLALAGRIIKKTVKYILYFFRNMSLIKKTMLILFCIVFLEFIVLSAGYNDGAALFFFWFFEKIILIPAILLIAINLQKLRQGGQKIAAGDLDYKVDTRYMFWDFKNHGENLNRINEGMLKAVEERLKSERFKTELITNVSHDIKTPLTSIINYVDLIKKENVENEKLKEYIDVLDRQSSRLKKLTEDLIEASKASTGNLPVNMVPTEIGVLLTQAAGEYEERIKNNGLELILEKPENETLIMADGRLLWRVFDNLLSNICKYAQPGTRVYLKLEESDGQAVITFRNISKYALNITSDELLERFVRGDKSRNTEGSGLGLSIAKSLTELQKGKLDLYIDGDLFKVVLKFDIIK